MPLASPQNLYERVYRSATGAGYVDVHPAHGTQELAANLAIAIELANRGEAVCLLPVVEGSKNLDATRNGLPWEFKTPVTANAKTALQRHVSDASAQGATRVLVLLNRRMTLDGVIAGLKLAFLPERAKKITDLCLLLPNGDLLSFRVAQMRAPHAFIKALKNRGGGQLQ